MSDHSPPIMDEKPAHHQHTEQHSHQRKWSLQNTEAEALGGLRTVEGGLAADQVADTLDIDEAEQKRILRKVDMRLVPLLTFLYL